ncbi:hypothetical protein WJX84_008824 [Apatococcus fuscideae]|uniref:Nuclear pore protein n=1 Tax=Apatococcus fuscideae TaxID=2026836 RepID=A0AAW1TE87_9CHLO
MNSNWDQLLQNSEALASRDAHGLPRIDRDIPQLEQLSQKLRSRTQRLDNSADQIAATRLLAQEGFNAQRLETSLQAFEIKPTHEDVFDVHANSVEEYLQRLHEMTVTTAIQAAQQDTATAFEAFMDRSMEQEWAAEKRRLFSESLPQAASIELLPSQASLTGHAVPGFMGAVAQLQGRERAYAETVHALNDAQASGQAFDAIASFSAACTSQPTGDQRTSIQRCWDLLDAVVSPAESIPVTANRAVDRAAAMVEGARRYLEVGHVQHVQGAIQASRIQARLGGEPSRMAQIQAFLRLRMADAGPLDFDTPGGGGTDTTWPTIFYCLRCGYHDEALQKAEGLEGSSGQSRGSRFAKALRDWLQPKRSAGGASGALGSMWSEVERLHRQSGPRQPITFRYKLLLHAILAGGKASANTVMREATTLLTTIEDFMWVLLSMVKPASSSQSSSAMFGGSPSFSEGPHREAYRLSDLQEYLSDPKWGAEHYSHGGREPLLYVTVLLLSLQFRRAVGFLARHKLTDAFRIDAPHFAIAMLAHEVGDVGGEGPAVGVDWCELLHSYGLRRAQHLPAVALEYSRQAVRAGKGGLSYQASLLRELLVQSQAFGFFVGSSGQGGQGGAMERFSPNEKERRRLVGMVAEECAREAQSEWAIELFRYAGQPARALRIISHLFSDRLEPALSDPASDEKAEEYQRRGNDAAQAMVSTMSHEDGAEKEAFEQLKIVRQMLQAHSRRDTGQVTSCAQRLQFLPQEDYRVQACKAAVQRLHSAVLDRLPSILLVAAIAQQVSAVQGMPGGLRVLANFAGELGPRLPRHICDQIIDLYTQVA